MTNEKKTRFEQRVEQMPELEVTVLTSCSYEQILREGTLDDRKRWHGYLYGVWENLPENADAMECLEEDDE